MIRRNFAKWVGLAAAFLAGVSITKQSADASELFSESVYVPPMADLNSSAYAAALSTGFSEVWKHLHILLRGDPTLPSQNATDSNTDPFAVSGTSTITISNPYVFPAGADGLWVGPVQITLG